MMTNWRFPRAEILTRCIYVYKKISIEWPAGIWREMKQWEGFSPSGFSISERRMAPTTRDSHTHTHKRVEGQKRGWHDEMLQLTWEWSSSCVGVCVYVWVIRERTHVYRGSPSLLLTLMLSLLSARWEPPNPLYPSCFSNFLSLVWLSFLLLCVTSSSP